MKVYINKDIDVADLNGDKVMMNMDLGKYFALNPVGSRIWEIIEEGPVTMDEIVNKLLSEYDVERNVCSESVNTFLDMLSKENLISIK